MCANSAYYDSKLMMGLNGIVAGLATAIRGSAAKNMICAVNSVVI